MSHWLSNVNTLLTKLDDQVETVVEERAFAKDDSSREAVGASITGIDDILAKRGLSSMGSNDKIEEEVEEAKAGEETVEQDEEGKESLKYEHDNKEGEVGIVSAAAVKRIEDDETSKTLLQSSENNSINKTTQNDPMGERVRQNPSTGVGKQVVIQQDSKAISSKAHVEGKPVFGQLEKDGSNSGLLVDKQVEAIDGQAKSNPVGQDEVNSSTKVSTLSKFENGSVASLSPPRETANTSATPTVSASLSFPSKHKEQKSQPHTGHSADHSRNEIRDLVFERKEAQKEARTLRRHIVSLNDQLETAESELQAQRKELERAAERMEKDRMRHNEENKASQKRNDDETTLLKKSHEKTLKAQKVKFEEQLERYRKKLSDEEQRRKQEGGDWNKEMSNAIGREEDMRETLHVLEDEKAVLLSQISTLQGQQTALGSRLESLSQAADNAIQRERDAETRLDAALNQHARQIGNRQARELQLERTIQDLNSALVLSRGNGQLTANHSSGGEGSLNEPLHGNSNLKARIGALEWDLKTANSHLAIEKERSETLQIQLRSFLNETKEEATVVHAKEIEYGRQIADMTTTISKLEEKVRLYEKASLNNSNPSVDSFDDQNMPQHMKVLSEEVVRLRDKIANHNSESLAMKNRLKAAVDRSKMLEEELHVAKVSPNNNGIISDSLQQGHIAVPGRRRRTVGANNNTSIRTAMLLHSLHGDRTEQIGKVVDQIDSFASSTGKYLRRNPLARAGFIFYLILIHLWTFVLLFFHAHSFDVSRGSEFGHVPPGPHSIFQQQHNFQSQHKPHGNETPLP